MAQSKPFKTPPPEQERKDIDRLVNEGGPDPVAAREAHKREEVWIETLEEQGGANRVQVALDHDSILKLEQKARQQGVTIVTLMGNVLAKFSNDEYVERSLEEKRKTPP